MSIQLTVSHPGDGEIDEVAILFLVLKLTCHYRGVESDGSRLHYFSIMVERIICVRITLCGAKLHIYRFSFPDRECLRRLVIPVGSINNGTLVRHAEQDEGALQGVFLAYCDEGVFA